MTASPSILTASTIASMVERAVVYAATHVRSDVLDALTRAQRDETHPRGRAVLGQLIENARIAHDDAVPLCQDTGTVWVLLEVGEDETIPGDIFSGVDSAVARAYEGAGLRMSVVRDALLDRTNTGNNTPAFTQIVLRPGSGATLHVMLKGGGSDNASRIVMLSPGAGEAGVRETLLETVREKASNACPPLLIGVGVGATFDKVAELAKHALLRPVGSINPDAHLAELEQELLDAVNALGLGPAALGGDTTALAVHIETASCHIAALPVAINMGCSAVRSVSVDLLEESL